MGRSLTAARTPNATASPARSGRRHRPFVVLAAALAVVVVAELAARTATTDLPDDWGLERVGTKVEQIASLGATEVVLLGDSTMDVGVDPVLLLEAGPDLETAYNASVPTGSPRFWRLWAEEVVAPGLAPQLVVIGLNSLAFNDSGTFRAEVRGRYEESPGRRRLVGETEGPAVRLCRWSALCRHRAELRAPGTWFDAAPAGAITPLGHDTTTAPVAYQVPEDYRRRLTERVLVDYSVGGAEVAALAELVALLRARGAAPVFVEMPVVEADHVPMHPRGTEDYEAYREAVAAAAGRLEVEVLTPPSDLFTREMFADPIHLNRRGTVVLSTWLATSLQGMLRG
jgi:hypothetical protein